MATMQRRSPSAGRLSTLSILLLLSWPPAAQAVLQPLDGQGNFHSYIDVVNRWRSEDRLDVLVLVEVANADIACEKEDGGYVGRLRIEVELIGPDGEVIERKRPVRTPALSADDAGSRTLHQVFGVVLEDVPFRSGELSCAVYDVNQRREGVLNARRRRSAVSDCVTDWYAEDGPRPAAGVALEQPLFLFQAPLADWNPAAGGGAGGDWLQDYAHPSRRYGLEQDHLQLFLPVWPAAGGIPADAGPRGLRVQVTSRKMDFALNDTIDFDARGRAALMAGRPAAVFYDLDLNILPEGPFQLSLAPLGGEGRGVLTEFTVAWRLGSLDRRHDLVMGEGRTVFSGRKLDRFLAASPLEREGMLDEFWREHDPDPENPVNEARLEFQYRMAYVQRFLGGIDETGARDQRGEVFLLLGPPDEVQRNPVPLNFRDQDDARIKVYDRWAPDRESVSSKGSSGSEDINPYANTQNPYGGIDGIPMPYSRRAEQDRQAAVQSASHSLGFEFWKYDRGGVSLFPNRFTDRGMGQRFLFVDRTGSGDYELESSNVVQGEE